MTHNSRPLRPAWTITSHLSAAAATVVLLSMVGSTSVLAQDTYPNRPIKLVLGFPPGGGADIVARIVADAMSQELGQPIIIDNRPGAGSTLAPSYVSKAAPDGYTLLVGANNMFGTDQYLYKSAKYDGERDFTAITQWTTAPVVIAVSNASGIQSVHDLVRVGRERELFFSSSGAGVGTHLAGLLFAELSGVKFQHVPYKGGAAAAQAVAKNEAQVTFATPPSVIPLAQGGRLRNIAVGSAERSPLLPELPSVSQVGLKDFEFTFWFGLFGPAGLSQDVVSRLHAASAKVLATARVKTSLSQTGNEVRTSASPAQFGAYAAADGRKLRELAQKSGAEVN